MCKLAFLWNGKLIKLWNVGMIRFLFRLGLCNFLKEIKGKCVFIRKYSLAPVELLSGEGWVCLLVKGWMDISQPKRLKRESQASRRQLNQQSQMERKMFEGRLRTRKWFHSISLFLIWFIRHFLWCCAEMFLLCCLSIFFGLWLPSNTLSFELPRCFFSIFCRFNLCGGCLFLFWHFNSIKWKKN